VKIRVLPKESLREIPVGVTKTFLKNSIPN